MSVFKIIREAMWVVVGLVGIGACLEYGLEWYYLIACVVCVVWGVKDIAGEIRDHRAMSDVAQLASERQAIADKLGAGESDQA